MHRFFREKRILCYFARALPKQSRLWFEQVTRLCYCVTRLCYCVIESVAASLGSSCLLNVHSIPLSLWLCNVSLTSDTQTLFSTRMLYDAVVMALLQTGRDCSWGNIQIYLMKTTKAILFFGLSPRKLVNTDTIRPGGGEKTLQPPRLPPPNRLSNTLSENAQL